AGPPPDLIIDAGAHIGCAATRFALRYPGAKILAVEAERRNFEALRANMARFPNVQCIHAAVWGSHGRVALADPDEEAWAFRVQPLSEETSASSHADYIPAVTVDELLAMAGAARIDLLKLDIEGAEKEVFNADVDKWLPRTRVMNIELHDRVTPGCTEAFNNALGRYHFKIVRRSRHNLTVENVA